MGIKSKNTVQGYQDALKRLEIIFNAEPNTAESDELEILGVL